MSIKTNDGFSIGSISPIDSRIVLKTYAEMKAINDATQPNVYFALCEQDSSLYLYNKSNTVDTTYGKFRKFEGGGANIWQGTKAEYEAQKDTIPNGTLIVITDDDEDTGSSMIHWIGTSAEWAALDKTSIPDGTVVILKDAQGENPIVTTWSSTPSDTNIPSEKLVKDNLCGFIDSTVITNIQVDDNWVSGDRDVTYTATENCYITGRLATNGTNSYVNILINNRLIQRAGHVTSTAMVLENQITFPLKKGQTLKFEVKAASGSTYMAVAALKMIY